MKTNDFFEAISFIDLEKMLSEQGCDFALVKKLAPNDNAKNQIFIGSDLFKGESERIDSRFLELACGSINFLKVAAGSGRNSIDG